MNSTLADAAMELACASASCAAADAACLPLDLLKVRMQLQAELADKSAKSLLSAPAMLRTILENEGAFALYAGLPAAVLRQVSYGGICFASYPHLRDALTPNDCHSPPLATRMAAGAAAGGCAAALANPTDVVKVRLQADGRLRLKGSTPRYRGATDAFATVLREEGARAFYRGTLANVQRAAFVNGIGIATYDHSKQTARSLLGEGDSLLARFVAALAGGVATSLAGCPFDVLKTRMMNDQAGAAAKYSSTAHCFVATLRSEGFLALWKGLLPVYLRQAPFNMLNYMLLELLTERFLGRSNY